MSTKNLARTVIEGGRAHGNCWDRRHSNRLQRPRERDALVGAARAGDFDDLVIEPRAPLWRLFHDKLSASERWLEAQVGRPWDLVRSELMRRFDPRTIAGRHIVFDQMLPSVHEAGVDCALASFLVDAHGLLRRTRWRYRRVSSLPPPLPRPEREVCAWLDRRRVGLRADVLFWFVPTDHGRYRQHRRLGADDVALWRSLPDWFRACHDPSAPPPLPTRVS